MIDNGLGDEGPRVLAQMVDAVQAAGRVLLQRFSPTGFYSSAVRNEFLRELEERNERQVAYTSEPVGDHLAEYAVGPRKQRSASRAGRRFSSGAAGRPWCASDRCGFR